MRSCTPVIVPRRRERSSWCCVMPVMLAGLAGLSLPAASTDGQEPSLDRLAQKCDYTAGRITSADPSGQNADFWTIAPGQTRVLAEIKGPGTIVHFRDNITSNERHHLQLHILRIYWDGESEPSVEVPIGDFFGVGFGFTEKYSSALMCIDQRRGKPSPTPAANGAARNCYIPMPFARSARMTLTNEGKVPSLHWVEINYRTYTERSPDLRYFHAQYRQGTPPPEGPYLILDAKGDGHLIGCVLSIKNNDGGWWGEGDEIVWIDGKRTNPGHRLGRLLLRVVRPAVRLLPLLRGPAPRRTLHHGLPLARPRPRSFPTVDPLPDRARQRQPPLP